MKLKDAFEAALDGIRYVDSLFIARDEHSLFSTIIFEHRRRNSKEADPHRAVISYLKPSETEVYTRVSKTSRLYPPDKRVTPSELPDLDPEEEGWHLRPESVRDLYFAKEELSSVIGAFTEN